MPWTCPKLYDAMLLEGGKELWELPVFTLERLGLMPSAARGTTDAGEGRENAGKDTAAGRRDVKLVEAASMTDARRLVGAFGGRVRGRIWPCVVFDLKSSRQVVQMGVFVDSLGFCCGLCNEIET